MFIYTTRILNTRGTPINRDNQSQVDFDDVYMIDLGRNGLDGLENSKVNGTTDYGNGK